MKKVIFSIGVILTLASCDSSASQNDTTTDSTSSVKADTLTGTKIDTVNFDSLNKDSVKGIK